MDEFRSHRKLVQAEQENSGALRQLDLRHNLDVKESQKHLRVRLEAGEKSLREAQRKLEQEKETVLSLGQKFRASGASC